jgi:hypothetical protein
MSWKGNHIPLEFTDRLITGNNDLRRPKPSELTSRVHCLAQSASSLNLSVISELLIQKGCSMGQRSPIWVRISNGYVLENDVTAHCVIVRSTIPRRRTCTRCYSTVPAVIPLKDTWPYWPERSSSERDGSGKALAASGVFETWLTLRESGADR